eukprot:TRINITY_DN1070_c0_g1_i3.p1 TRINITY_DN1070_c0_g1~~TRINITY_DN1070_c0_g1_i3.p1  ORF type:complete len:498 (-),score=123.48 TRINITY_DN1070_c0_g1_i3:13-1506(-)
MCAIILNSIVFFFLGKHWIGGKLVSAHTGATFDVHNPATGKVIGNAARGDVQDVEVAINSAVQSQAKWKNLHSRQKSKLLYQCGELLAQHVEELARLTSLETGKAIRTESRVEAGLVSDIFRYYAGLTSEIKGNTLPFSPTSLTFTQREPLGVVGAIIPWNAPLLLMALKVAPALACGNSIVLKSAEQAPFGALRIGQLISSQVLHEYPGLLNVISGFGKECGGPLVDSKHINKISFTGSVETGKEIGKKAGERLIPVTLELGGKSPMIICDDADLDKAVDGAIAGMRFTRQGQSCTAASRMFVHSKVFNQFLEKVKAKVNALVMGDPLDDKTDIGTIISKQQYDKVLGFIEFGKNEIGKGTVHICNKLPSKPELENGLFVQPVIFSNIGRDARVAKEEIFGPVACVFEWDNFDEVVAVANDTEFGLSASVWTTNLQTAMQAVQRLDAGIVQVNQNAVVQPNLPVGGFKQSGLGKEGSLEAMLESFTKEKTVSINMF